MDAQATRAGYGATIARYNVYRAVWRLTPGQGFRRRGQYSSVVFFSTFQTVPMVTTTSPQRRQLRRDAATGGMPAIA